MPVEYKFLDDGIGVLLEAEGRVTGQKLIETLAEIYRSEEKAKKFKYSIIDFTDIEKMDVSNGELDLISEKHRDAGKLTADRVIAVAAGKDIAFGLSRMWQASIDDNNWDITIVRTRNEAESWVREKVRSKFDIDITME